MPYVRETSPNIFVQILPTETVEGYPPTVWQSWPQAQQEAMGIFAYVPFMPLPGMHSAGTNQRFQRINGVVREAFDVVAKFGRI